MTTIYKVLLGVALLLGVAGLFLPQVVSVLGGTTNLDSLTLSGTLTAATIVNTGSFISDAISATTGFSIAGGATTTVSNCTSTSWNPGAISTSTVATTTVTAIPGITAGDIVSLSIDTSTVSSTNQVAAILSGAVSLSGASTGTITAQLSWPATGPAAGVWDIATTTLRACWRRQ